MSKTLALYMRLSSEDGTVGESDSISNQRDLLHRFVESKPEFNGCEVLEFWDDGFSGTNFNRPQVKRMLLMVRQKRINCIIVKDFSRFGRNYVDVCDYLEQVFPIYGVRFLSVTDNYDSDKTKGSSVGMDVALKSMIHEMYSRDISTKIRSANKVRWAKGEYLGTIAFYGYKLSDTIKNRLVPDEPTAEVVRRMFSLAAGGMKPNDIAILFNKEKTPTPLMYRKQNGTHEMRGWTATSDEILWTRHNVKRILCDERYTGTLVSYKHTKADVSSKRVKFLPKEEWVIAENAHEPLVTKAQFEEAGKHFKPLKHKGSMVSRGYPLTGILKCGYCNHNLARVTVKQPYFSCHMARFEEKSPCSHVRVQEKEFSGILLAVICKQVEAVLLDGKNPSEFTLTNHERLLRLTAAIKKQQDILTKLKTARKNVFEEYYSEHITKERYSALLTTNSEQSTTETDKLQALQNEYAGITENSRETEYQPTHRKYGFADELTREMVMELVKEIRVFGDDRFEIVWNYEDYYRLSDVMT